MPNQLEFAALFLANRFEAKFWRLCHEYRQQKTNKNFPIAYVIQSTEQTSENCNHVTLSKHYAGNVV